MVASFETYLRRCWDVQRDILTASPRRLVAGWEDDECLKIKIHIEENLRLEETLKACYVVTLIRSVFNNKNKYCPQIFLEEFLFKFSK